MQAVVPATKTTATQDTLLRRILMIDSEVSALCGASLIVAAEPAVRFLGIQSPLAVAVLGAVCLIFAGFVWFVRRESPVDRSKAMAVVALNGIGVVASDIVLLADPFKLSDGGKLFVLLFALTMAVLGVLEWQGVRRSNAANG
jgi:hypothetical protein